MDYNIHNCRNSSLDFDANPETSCRWNLRRIRSDGEKILKSSDPQILNSFLGVPAPLRSAVGLSAISFSASLQKDAAPIPNATGQLKLDSTSSIAKMYYLLKNINAGVNDLIFKIINRTMKRLVLQATSQTKEADRT